MSQMIKKKLHEFQIGSIKNLDNAVLSVNLQCRYCHETFIEVELKDLISSLLWF